MDQGLDPGLVSVRDPKTIHVHSIFTFTFDNWPAVLDEGVLSEISFKFIPIFLVSIKLFVFVFGSFICF